MTFPLNSSVQEFRKRSAVLPPPVPRVVIPVSDLRRRAASLQEEMNRRHHQHWSRLAYSVHHRYSAAPQREASPH